MDVQKLKNDLATAQASLKTLGEEKSALESDKASLTEELSTCNEKISTLESANADLKKEKESFTATETQLEDATKALNSEKEAHELLKKDFDSQLETKVEEQSEKKAQDLLIAKAADAGIPLNLGDEATDGAQGGSSDNNLKGLAKAQAAIDAQSVL